MNIKNIKKLNFKNKKVLLRVNFDVPIKNGRVGDDSRILAHLPTINFLLKQGAQVIIISHLGRPSEVNSMRLKIQRYGLKPVFNYLKKTIKNLNFIESLEWPVIKKEIANKKIVLLENLRFYPGEKDNDKNFAKFLASLADIYPVRSSSKDHRYIKSKGEAAFAAQADSRNKDSSKTSNGVYVNDAFAVSHRNHASVSAITQYLPSYAGLLLEKEVTNLSEIIVKSKHPFVVLMGGAKISTKMPVLKTLAKQADQILVGGALANDLLKMNGYNIAQSFSEKHSVKINKKIIEKIVLPVDVVIKQGDKIKNIKIDILNKYKDFKILDIGKQTIQLFANYLENARIIVWNGPMGLFEKKPFDQGTKKILKEILKNKKAKIIIGGGDTIMALNIKSKSTNLKSNVFVSTGGGAMLEFLSGKVLPGIRPLMKK